MKCKNCGNEIEKGEKFCKSCGTKVSENSKIKKILKYTLMGFGGFMIICLVIGMFSTDEEKDTKPNSTTGTAHVSSQDNTPKTLEFPLTIKNYTGFDIYYLYSSVASTDNWEEDILGDYGVLDDGETIIVNYVLDTDSLVWDFKIVDYNYDYIEFYGVDFSDCDMNGATLVLEYDGYEGTATLY